MASGVKIEWWEPYRETLRSTRDVCRRLGLWSPLRWFKVWIISALVMAALTAGASALVPGVVLPWLQIGLVTVFGLPVVLVVSSAGMFAPRNICVRQDIIRISHGQSTVRIEPERVITIDLATDPSGIVRLNLLYLTRQGKERSRSIAVSPRTDVQALRMMLAGYGECFESAESGRALAGRST